MATRARVALAGRRRRYSLVEILLALALATVTGLATVKLASFQHQLKAFIIVVALIAMIAAALRPEIGLLVVLAVSPFELKFYGTNSTQVILVLLAVTLVWRIRGRSLPWWVACGGIALVLGSFIAVIGAHEHAIALEGAIDWLCTMVVLFVALTVLRDRPQAPRRAADVFVGASMIVVIFAFLQKAGVYAIVGAPFNAGHPNSFFYYYTVYAGYVAIAGVLATAEILIALDERRIARAYVFGAALVVLLAGIAISTSRGGLLALGAGWMMFILLNIRRGSVLARVIIVLALAGAAGYVATPHSAIVTIEKRFATSSGSLGEDRQRFAVQKAGERALTEFPFGLGYGNFQYYLVAEVRSNEIHQPFFHAQETFIQVGLDSGWLGLAGFLALFAGPVILAFRRGRGGPSAVRASAFAAAMVGFGAQGLYDYVLWDLSFVVFFAVLVWGTLSSLAVDERTDQAPEADRAPVGPAEPVPAVGR